MADSPKTCYIIVGVPRSGTSSIAQFLEPLGVYYGNPAHFLDTTKLKHNPIFYELQWINDFNDRVFQAWHLSYLRDVMPGDADFDLPEIVALKSELRKLFLEEFGDRAVVGVKDPRICFTFPIWREVVGELGYEIKTVLAVRAASAIIKSNRALTPGRLSRWQRFYARHLLAVRYFTRDVAVCLFDFDLLMRDPIKYGKQKAVELGLAVADPAKATRHLSREHYHHQPDDLGTGDRWVDRIDADLRAGRLDPNEYLAFRSVAALYIGDLDEQDREIQAALAVKDSYIKGVEARNKEAAQLMEGANKHIASLEAQRKRAAEQIEMMQQRETQLQAELQRVQTELLQPQEELRQRQGRLDSLSGELGALSAKHAELERQFAALAQQLEALRSRRMVRLMHSLDRLVRGRSEPAAP